MRSRLFFVGLALPMTAAACTFIEVNLLDGGGSSSSGSGGASASSGGTGGASSSGSGGASSTSSTSSSGAAGGSSTSSGCCDCDNDGHDSVACDGGDDCNDQDSRVFPGQTLYFDTQADGGGYDFNCVNGPEKDPMLDTAHLCVVCVNDEMDAHYFAMTSPSCGMPGEWGTCKAVTCAKNVIDPTLKMKCH